MLTLGKYLRRLGRNLAQARAKSGLKQMEVSLLSGVSYRHYQNIEAGKVNVTIGTLYRLSMIYRIPVFELIKDE